MAWNVADRYALNRDGTADNAAKLETMRAEIDAMAASKKPLPQLTFPEGIYSFSQWPNMAYHNLVMRAEGQAILKYTGTGDAVTFAGEATGPKNGLGKRNIVFDGFTIVPNIDGKDGLVIDGCHAGRFRVNVRGAGRPVSGGVYSAIHVKGCVCATIEPTVSVLDPVIDGYTASYECLGLNLDVMNNNPQSPAAATEILRPVIEGCYIGMQVTNGFFCVTRDGTIEASTNIGVYIRSGGYNSFINVEMEANKNYDVWCTKDAHENQFLLCGDGHRSRFKTRIEGYFTNNVITPMGAPFS